MLLFLEGRIENDGPKDKLKDGEVVNVDVSRGATHKLCTKLKRAIDSESANERVSLVATKVPRK